jgi:hypothetical protein
MNEDLEQFINSMSSFEIIELGLSFNASTLDQASMFMSGLFAYIAASYFAGSKLSRFQYLAITGIYSAFSFFTIGGYVGISNSYIAFENIKSGTDLSFMLYGAALMLITSWIVSILFMLSVRKSDDT